MLNGSGLISVTLFAIMLGTTIGQEESTASERFRLAKSAFDQGNYRSAAADFRRVARWYEEQGNGPSRAIVLYNLATVYHAMGQTKLAFEVLDDLTELSEELDDRVLARRVESLFATVAAFSRRSGLAREHFTNVLESAQRDGDVREIAQTENDFGAFLASEGEVREAKEHLDRAITLSRDIGDHLLEAKAVLNRALLFLNTGLELRDRALLKNRGDMASDVFAWLKNVRIDVDTMVKLTGKLEDSEPRATLLISAGEIYQTLGEAGATPLADLNERSFQAYEAAIRTSKVTGNRRALSFSLGGLARLYEDQERFEEALRLSRAARDLAQEISSPDSLFLWEWQCGRMLTRLDRKNDAIASYRRAGETLQSIRHDIAIAHGKRRAGKSFREAIGPLYFELAGLLVEQGKVSSDPERREELLFEARDVIEEFKTAELEDYFQDDCVNLFLSETERQVDDLTGQGAVFYLIPLEEKTHVLVNAAGNMFEFESSWSREWLMSQANQFREALENQATFLFREQATAFYDELIRPAEGILEEAGIDTIIFVPDGELRTVPIAAFHDGEKFLIERYAVAVTPGLRLMDSEETDWDDVPILIGGLTQSVAGYPALVHVAEEVEAIEGEIAGATAWLDGEFLEESFVEEVQGESHRIVHIASHGEFGKDSKSSFVLTHDGRIDLDEMELMIKPRQFDGDPVELLALSACRTAVGDDRAALGLAGVAVKSGARSVIASLWYIDDRATSEVMRRFYRELTSSPGISKAQALRRAQLTMIDRHPCYWSPFLIIGNWL